MGDAAILSFDEVARFLIDFATRTITIFETESQATPPDFEHILNDHIAPRILAQMGALVVHASAVEIGGKLAVFLGESGAGKSTLSASLQRAGHRLLTDDALIVMPGSDNAGFAGEPVYPSLRLFPDVIDALLGPATHTAPMASYSDKRLVALGPSAQHAWRAAPIGALFFLSRDGDQTACEAQALAPSMACIRLIEQSFTLDARDRECGARRLAQASRLALAVPAFALHYPRDFAQLAEVGLLITGTLGAHQPLQSRSQQDDTAQ